MSSGGKNFLRYFSLAFAAFGLLFLVLGAGTLKEEFESRSWKSAPGTIMKSQVDPMAGKVGKKRYRASIRYEYQIADKRYRSDRISTLRPVYKSQSKAQEVVTTYPLGRSVTVY